jgi:hypothetical protein
MCQCRCRCIFQSMCQYQRHSRCQCHIPSTPHLCTHPSPLHRRCLHRLLSHQNCRPCCFHPDSPQRAIIKRTPHWPSRGTTCLASQHPRSLSQSPKHPWPWNGTSL